MLIHDYVDCTSFKFTSAASQKFKASGSVYHVFTLNYYNLNIPLSVK